MVLVLRSLMGSLSRSLLSRLTAELLCRFLENNERKSRPASATNARSPVKVKCGQFQFGV